MRKKKKKMTFKPFQTYFEKQRHMTLEIQVLSWNMAGLNPLTGFQ